MHSAKVTEPPPLGVQVAVHVGEGHRLVRSRLQDGRAEEEEVGGNVGGLRRCCCVLSRYFVVSALYLAVKLLGETLL